MCYNNFSVLKMTEGYYSDPIYKIVNVAATVEFVKKLYDYMVINVDLMCTWSVCGRHYFLFGAKLLLSNILSDCNNFCCTSFCMRYLYFTVDYSPLQCDE